MLLALLLFALMAVLVPSNILSGNPIDLKTGISFYVTVMCFVMAGAFLRGYNNRRSLLIFVLLMIVLTWLTTNAKMWQTELSVSIYVKAWTDTVLSIAILAIFRRIDIYELKTLVFINRFSNLYEIERLARFSQQRAARIAPTQLRLQLITVSKMLIYVEIMFALMITGTGLINGVPWEGYISQHVGVEVIQIIMITDSCLRDIITFYFAGAAFVAIADDWQGKRDNLAY